MVTLAAVPAAAKTHAMVGQHGRYCAAASEPLDQDRMARRLKLTDAQKLSLRDFEATRTKAETAMQATVCGGTRDFSTLSGRIAAQQAFLEAHLAALKAEAPSLVAFYSTLDERQQARFDDMRTGFVGRSGRHSDGARGGHRGH